MGIDWASTNQKTKCDIAFYVLIKNYVKTVPGRNKVDALYKKFQNDNDCVLIIPWRVDNLNTHKNL